MTASYQLWLNQELIPRHLGLGQQPDLLLHRSCVFHHRWGLDIQLSIELSKITCSTLEHNAEPGHRALENDAIDVEGSALRKLAGLGANERLVVVGVRRVNLSARPLIELMRA
jgi:hypothetical protein